MLKPAVLYKEALSEKVINTWFVDKYKYWAMGPYYDSYEAPTNTFNNHSFVSL